MGTDKEVQFEVVAAECKSAAGYLFPCQHIASAVIGLSERQYLDLVSRVNAIYLSSNKDKGAEGYDKRAEEKEVRLEHCEACKDGQ